MAGGWKLEAGNWNCLHLASAHNHGFTLVEMLMGMAIFVIVITAFIGGFYGQSQLNSTARNLTLGMNDATRVMEQIRLQNTGSTGTCTGASPYPSANPPTEQDVDYKKLNWDKWMTAKGFKSINVGQPKMELVVVSCQDGTVNLCTAGQPITTCSDTPPPTCPHLPTDQPADPEGKTVQCRADGIFYASFPSHCSKNQIGQQEWTPWWSGAPGAVNTASPNFPIIRVTVAVGWWQQQRGMGGTGAGAEFTYLTVGGGCQSVLNAMNAGPDANRNGVIESQAMLTTLVTCR